MLKPPLVVVSLISANFLLIDLARLIHKLRNIFDPLNFEGKIFFTTKTPMP